MKMQAILATKLRLAPQSRLGTRTAGRLARIASLPPPPWELGDDAKD